jgi:hypothetical protein
LRLSAFEHLNILKRKSTMTAMVAKEIVKTSFYDPQI